MPLNGDTMLFCLGYLGILPFFGWGYLGIPGDTWGYLGILGDTWGYLFSITLVKVFISINTFDNKYGQVFKQNPLQFTVPAIAV